MNWRKPIYKTKLYIRTPNILKNLAEYEKTQWYTNEQLQNYQQNKLLKLLEHASQHVPYYKKIFREYGVYENGKIVLENFKNIPFLTKDILRNHFEELKSDDLNRRGWEKNTSGGSTGEPVVFIQDKEFAEKCRAKSTLGSKMAGKDFCEPEILLWGSERDLYNKTKGLRVRFDNFVFNQKLFNTFRMSPEDMTNYISVINDINPKLIIAYAQSAYDLAQFSLQESLPIHNVGAVITSAGTLYDFMRETISKSFHSPVFNRYGSREVGIVAIECEAHLGLHVSMETQLVEVVDNQGFHCKPDDEGEIVITSLINYSMPLIRYRIGDMGIWSEHPCSCGRGATLLKTVTGRVSDSFVTKKMERIYSGYFMVLLFYKDWVKKYQFIQEDFDLIRIKIQKNSEPPKGDIEEIEDKIRFVMGQSCKIEFEFVDDIMPTGSGKFRYTMNAMKQFNDIR